MESADQWLSVHNGSITYLSLCVGKVIAVHLPALLLSVAIKDYPDDDWSGPHYMISIEPTSSALQLILLSVLVPDVQHISGEEGLSWSSW